MRVLPIGGFLGTVRALVVMGTLLALLVWAAPGATAQTGGMVYALNDSNELLVFDRSDPGQIDFRLDITDMAAGENIVGIDFRPDTDELFALGSASTIYNIDPQTGAADAVGGQFTPALEGTAFGFDFNPTVDRIRVVSDTGQNLRLNPDTGLIGSDPETDEPTVDGTLAYAEGDENEGAQPRAVGAGYTNSVPDADETTLYDIDSGLGVLVTQDPPNDGTLNTVGPLGVSTTDNVGFDVAADDDTALAALQPGAGQPSSLYEVDLSTGAATGTGTIGSGETVTGLAIPATEIMLIPETGGISPVAILLLAGGGVLLALAGFVLVIRRGLTG